MTTFKELIKAIEGNDEGQWNCWEDAKHIQEVYGELEDENKDVAEKLLNNLIRNEGREVDMCLEMMSYLEYGVVMSKGM